MKLYLLLTYCFYVVFANNGLGGSNQNWGFVQINEKAHMFWWLYYTTASEEYTQRPLVIWLQGGPGGSSTAIGNFQEIGPLDVDMKERDIHWVQHVNVLFVDNPVGTGFSYVEDEDADFFANDNYAIAQDFMVFLKEFISDNSEFRNVPIYIVGQSYGGKMAADIALLIHQEKDKDNFTCNLKGIALGDAWISPIDSLTTWPTYLYNLGFLNDEDMDTITKVTNFVAERLSAGIYENATTYFHVTQYMLNQLTTVDYYNVMTEKYMTYNLKNSELQEKPIDADILMDLLPIDFKTKKLRHLVAKPQSDDTTTLYDLMNGLVLETLNLTNRLPIKWGDQSEIVFQSVDFDFMKPVTGVVEQILNETDIEVTIYNGQLDLIVDTPGTVAWVNRLTWKDADHWKAVSKNPILINNVYEGYQKSYGNLNLYCVQRAGHSVPTDNPHTMEFILKKITHLN